jgi:hypothetical protein
MAAKPAWYSIEGQGFLRDFVNLLHLPYTLWHISYVVMGIAIAPTIFVGRSVATVIAFLLGLGVGAHALDETMGNPLQTKRSKAELYALGFGALAAAIAIGIYYVIALSVLLLPFLVIEAFFAIVYNLEIFGKRFHTTLIFALSWGSIPFLTGYFVNALSLSLPALIVAIAVGLLTVVQRTLSTQARFFRRKLPVPVESLKLASGTQVPVSSSELIFPSERSLKVLTATVFLLAIALLLARFLSVPI